MILTVSCHTLIPMNKPDAHEKLRRAASMLAHPAAGDRTVLLQAWEVLRGLRSDELPVDMRASFEFLRHEIARAESEDVSTRDVVFLTNKLRQLESMWVQSPEARVLGSSDGTA